MNHATQPKRIILINGATGALGQALAKHFNQPDTQLILFGRDANKLDKLAGELEQTNPEQIPLIQPVDLSGAAPEDYQTLFDAVQTHAGRIDLMIDAMGQPGNPTPLSQADLMDAQTTMHVNFTARFALARSLFSLLEDGKQPTLLLLTDQPAPAYTGAYAISQTAVQQLIDQWGREQGKVRILGFNPGPVASSLRQKHFPGEHPKDRSTPEQAVATLDDWLEHARSGEIKHPA